MHRLTHLQLPSLLIFVVIVLNVSEVFNAKRALKAMHVLRYGKIKPQGLGYVKGHEANEAELEGKDQRSITPHHQ